jgi:MSHA biogenesis protein MshQ
MKMVFLIILGVLFCPPCWAATVLDRFNNRSYDNNNGTQRWATDWMEVGDDGDPEHEDIQIVNDQGRKYVLRLQNSDLSIQREANLSGATSATLTFDYRRNNLSWSFFYGYEYVLIEVSNDGGVNWNELDRISGSFWGVSDSSYISASYDISNYISDNTRIRLKSCDFLPSNHQVYFDNIQIEYEIPDTPQIVAYYALDGDENDSSGNGHDGSSTGTVAYAPAYVCDGVELDGGGYVSAPDDDDAFNLPNALTVMAWIKADSLSVSGHDSLYTVFSKDTNYELHVQNDGALYWWWQDSSEHADSITTNSGLIRTGTWYHVAIVYSRSAGTMLIYRNGRQVDSQSYSSQLATNNNPFYIGTDIDTGNGREYTNPTRRFYGLIDEVRVYSNALSPTQIQELMNATHPCRSSIDHFEIAHDGHALTCQPEAVTITACSDDNDPCTPVTASAVTVTLSPSGWLGGDQKTFTGSDEFWLRHTTPGTVTLGIGNSSLTPTHATRCYEGSTLGDCTLEFHETGFIFTVPDLTSCQASSSIGIQAVRMDETSQACTGIESFANASRRVRFRAGYVEPSSGTRSLSVNGTAVSTAGSGTEVSLSFNATATASLVLSYADAGRMDLNASYIGSGDEAGLVMEGADQFVVAPYQLLVSATTNGTTPLDNASSSGSPHWKAGENFHVAVSGACADGTLTPNFAWETVLSPAGCNPACGALGNGTLTAVDFENGTASPDDIYYSEVGTLKIQALAGNYLASGIDISGESTTVGRFTPHHFAVILNEPKFRTGCESGGFSYLGEPLDYETRPVITVTAQNSQGGTTQNYTGGSWWKLTDDSLAGKAYSILDGVVDSSRLPTDDPAISDLGGGMGKLTFSAGSGIVVVRDSPEAPFDAEISLEINVMDEDGIAATANPVAFGQATEGNGIAFDSGKQMRWGRLTLENAYGSELAPLAMPLRIEYYDGSAFALNSADGCTGINLSQIILRNGSGSVTGEAPIAVGGGSSRATLSPLVAGAATLGFSAPGSEGYIDVLPDLSLLSWLRYDWDGDGNYDNDPAARASFGLFKGRPALIYLRESYR